MFLSQMLPKSHLEVPNDQNVHLFVGENCQKLRKGSNHFLLSQMPPKSHLGMSSDQIFCGAKMPKPAKKTLKIVLSYMPPTVISGVSNDQNLHFLWAKKCTKIGGKNTILFCNKCPPKSFGGLH